MLCNRDSELENKVKELENKKKDLEEEIKEIKNIVEQKNTKFRDETMCVYSKLKEVLTYYKEFKFESKEEDIKKLEYIIKNNDNNYEEYIKDFEEAKKMNDRLNLINYLYESNYRAKYKEKNEEVMNRAREYWRELEKQIQDKRIKKMPKAIAIILFKYFNDENNREELLKIFNEDQIECFIKENEKLKKFLNNSN